MKATFGLFENQGELWWSGENFPDNTADEERPYDGPLPVRVLLEGLDWNDGNGVQHLSELEELATVEDIKSLGPPHNPDCTAFLVTATFSSKENVLKALTLFNDFQDDPRDS